MPWTNPETFTAGQTLTAASMNIVSENLRTLAQYGADAWTAYTPTWTSLTIGNATQSAAYIKLGRMYVVRFRVAFGSTTSISGQPEMTLPNSATLASNYTDGTPLGYAQFADVGTASYVALITQSTSVATRVRMFSLSAAGTYLSMSTASATVPFTWTTGDVIDGQYVFEATA